MAATAHLHLLGTFQLIADDQTITAFRSDKVRALLAWLTIEANRPHQRQIPATLLWEEHDDRGALKNLRMSLSNLKKVLSDNGLVDTLNITRSQLEMRPGNLLQCDVTQLLQLLDDVNAHGHPDSAICDACWDNLTQAVALYRGEFMAGLLIDDAEAFYQWQLTQREQLHELVSAALSTLIGAARQRADEQELRRFARRQLALTPWHEEAHRALMQSLAREGRHAEALAQFESCQQVLWDEMGVEPAAETTALRDSIASHDVPPAASSQQLATSNLPRLQPAFFGRKSQRLRITDLIRDPTYPLVTLVGNGGIGKTQLALTVAADLQHEMPDGVWFVALEHIAPSAADTVRAAVLNAIGQALRLDLSRSQNQLADLTTWLRDRRLLLILDNLEHLQNSATVPQLVQALLADVAELTVLATSRRPLNLRVERIERLAGLPVPQSAESATGRSSIQLFTERAQRASNYQLNHADLDAIVTICRQVEGSPLAIELAAGWTTHMSPQAIATALQRDLGTLQTPLLDVPERHRSLEAVFDYSWELLTHDEQRVLAQLSVFQGAFTLAAAEQVAQTNVMVLAGLVDKSLLWVSTNPEVTEVAETTAYTLPVVIRRFADVKLNATLSQLAPPAIQRHALYFIDQLIKQTEALQFNHDALVGRQLAAQFADLQQAWSWCITHEKWRHLNDALLPFFHLCDTRSLYRQGAAVLAQLIEQSPTPATALLIHRAKARHAWFLFQLGDVAAARHSFTQAIEKLQQLDAQPETVFCHSYLGALLMHGGDYVQAQQHVQIAHERATAGGDQLGQMIALNLLGRIAWFNSDAAANDHYRASLAIARQLGHLWSSSFSLDYLGEVAFSQQNYAAAQRLYEESLAIRQQLDDKRGSSLCANKLGDIATAQGETAQATALYQRALATFEQIGNLLGVVDSLERLGTLAMASDDLVTARRYYMQALGLHQAAPSTLRAIDGMAQVLLAEGDGAQAVALWGWLVQAEITPAGLREQIVERLQAVLVSAEIPTAHTHKYATQSVQQVASAIY